MTELCVFECVRMLYEYNGLEMKVLKGDSYLFFSFGCVLYVSNLIFSTIWWYWKEFEWGSWKDLKIDTFGDNFGTIWHRGLKFWHIVHI